VYTGSGGITKDMDTEIIYTMALIIGVIGAIVGIVKEMVTTKFYMSRDNEVSILAEGLLYGVCGGFIGAIIGAIIMIC
jgi:hypothetical protein